MTVLAALALATFWCYALDWVTLDTSVAVAWTALAPRALGLVRATRTRRGLCQQLRPCRRRSRRPHRRCRWLAPRRRVRRAVRSPGLWGGIQIANRTGLSSRAFSFVATSLITAMLAALYFAFAPGVHELTILSGPWRVLMEALGLHAGGVSEVFYADIDTQYVLTPTLELLVPVSGLVLAVAWLALTHADGELTAKRALSFVGVFAAALVLRALYLQSLVISNGRPALMWDRELQIASLAVCGAISGLAARLSAAVGAVFRRDAEPSRPLPLALAGVGAALIAFGFVWVDPGTEKAGPCAIL